MLKTMNTVFYSTTMLLGLLSLGGCASAGAADEDGLIPTVEKVDLERFMGDWYVAGFIPVDNFLISEEIGRAHV